MLGRVIEPRKVVDYKKDRQLESIQQATEKGNGVTEAGMEAANDILFCANCFSGADNIKKFNYGRKQKNSQDCSNW